MSGAREPATAPPATVADPRDHVRWHDLECGGYQADLALWRRMAADAPAGRILELGAGTGRIALDLAAAGSPVVGVDVDPVLCAELGRRSRARRLPAEATCADARSLDLGERFALVLLPMQTVQLLGGPPGRRALLDAIRAHLSPGALAAAALVEEVEPFTEGDGGHVAPDMRDHAGTVYASRTVRVAVEGDEIVLDRLRERVEPDGTRRTQEQRTRLDVLGADRLEREIRDAGLRVGDRRTIAATSDHVASRVVVFGD